ncbi:hypothetical protein ACO0RG_004359 [Hanseniaspora osmophila]
MDKTAQFMEITGCSYPRAVEFLTENHNDLTNALQEYYISQEQQEYQEPSTASAPESAPSSSFSSSTANKKSGNQVKNTAGNNKFKSFQQLMKESSLDEDDDDPDKRNTFAGGETSGLEIADPNKDKDKQTSKSLIRDLLEKAKRGGELPPAYGEDDDNDEDNDNDNDDDDDGNNNSQGQKGKKNKKKFFTGQGHRLGSSLDEPSATGANNTGAQGQQTNDILGNLMNQSKPKRVTREITFWKEGFQVGSDGELYRYDDPKNDFFLKELNQGRAPLNLLNVEFGQEVDVNVYRKLDESFKPPKRKLEGFHGQGQRLGAPVPGEVYPQEKAQTEVNVPACKNQDSAHHAAIKNRDSTNDKQGDTQIQIRLVTGKREVYKCFSSDSVQTVYDYVKSKTDDKTRPFTLNHAFPTKPIFDFSKSVKDEGLCNATIVQRWV